MHIINVFFLISVGYISQDQRYSESLSIIGGVVGAVVITGVVTVVVHVVVALVLRCGRGGCYSTSPKNR